MDKLIFLPPEFIETLYDVKSLGDKKYGTNSWLQKGVVNSRDNFSSISRHIAEGYNNPEAIDHETLVHPWGNAAYRLLMEITLHKRGIL